MEARHDAGECHSGRCNRSEIEPAPGAWDDSLMNKDVDMGIAGSLTMIILVSSMAFLLRSFYKRYTRLQKREDGQN
jgi:hypothetical protein